MTRLKRRTAGENPGAGEDSFLDIVSNMVGILIILVMIAGVRLGDAIPEEGNNSAAVSTASDSTASDSTAAKSTDTDSTETGSEQTSEPETAAAANSAVPSQSDEKISPKSVTAEDQARYLQAAEQIKGYRSEIGALQAEVAQLNEQTELLKSQTEGSQGEYSSLMEEVARAEALIERLGREKTDAEKEGIQKSAELTRLNEEMAQLEKQKKQLATSRPKSTLLENVPTPLTKKIEGNEAVFVLLNGRISYVPIGEFSERVRGIFRSLRDFNNDQIDETLGPVDGYRFHFQASLHKVQTHDGTQMSIVFDGGEFLPAAPQMGEEIAAALTDQSAFRQKLGLFLQDSSTITLAVYPDSFEQLRDVKKYLLQNGYNIALRPMPAGKNIRISPNGTESTAY